MTDSWRDVVLENALDAVVAVDATDMVIDWNRQAEVIFGWSRVEARGRQMSELLIPPAFRAMHRRGMQHYIDTGEGPILNKRIELDALRRDGATIAVELTVIPIATPQGQIFYSFIRDIGERKRMESELRESIRARDEFLSVASHELKTPLTSLKLQAQLHRRRIAKSPSGQINSQDLERLMETTEQQVDRLTHLVDDMLDVSRAMHGRLQYRFEQFDLSALIAEVIDRFSDDLKAVGYSWTEQLDPYVIVAWDRFRIDQVITNLLSNAIKYGERQPIEIRLALEGERAHLILRDRGPGIAAEDAERIFQRFERATAASQISGLGLGLYIARQIVEAHRGRIWVERAEGGGSAFHVEIPLLLAAERLP